MGHDKTKMFTIWDPWRHAVFECVCALWLAVAELQQDWSWNNHSDSVTCDWLLCAGTHFSRHQHSHATSCRHFHLATPLPTEFPPTGLVAPQYQEVPPSFLPQALQQQYLIQQQLLQRRYTHHHSNPLYKSYSSVNTRTYIHISIFTAAPAHKHKKYVL